MQRHIQKELMPKNIIYNLMKYIKKFENKEDKSNIFILDYSNQGLTKLPDLSEYINLKYL